MFPGRQLVFRHFKRSTHSRNHGNGSEWHGNAGFSMDFQSRNRVTLCAAQTSQTPGPRTSAHAAGSLASPDSPGSF